MGLSGRRGLNACDDEVDAAGLVMLVEEVGSKGENGLLLFWLLAAVLSFFDCAAEEAVTIKVTGVLGTVVKPVTTKTANTRMTECKAENKCVGYIPQLHISNTKHTITKLDRFNVCSKHTTFNIGQESKKHLAFHDSETPMTLTA